MDSVYQNVLNNLSIFVLCEPFLMVSCCGHFISELIVEQVFTSIRNLGLVWIDLFFSLCKTAFANK